MLSFNNKGQAQPLSVNQPSSNKIQIAAESIFANATKEPHQQKGSFFNIPQVEQNNNKQSKQQNHTSNPVQSQNIQGHSDKTHKHNDSEILSPSHYTNKKEQISTLDIKQQMQNAERIDKSKQPEDKPLQNDFNNVTSGKKQIITTPQNELNTQPQSIEPINLQTQIFSQQKESSKDNTIILSNTTEITNDNTDKNTIKSNRRKIIDDDLMTTKTIKTIYQSSEISNVKSAPENSEDSLRLSGQQSKKRLSRSNNNSPDILDQPTINISPLEESSDHKSSEIDGQKEIRNKSDSIFSRSSSTSSLNQDKINTTPLQQQTHVQKEEQRKQQNKNSRENSQIDK